MAKTSGTTRVSRPSSGGRTSTAGVLKSNSIPSNLKLSDFEQGFNAVSGTDYNILTADNYVLNISLEHGHNDEYHQDGTTIIATVQKGTDSRTTVNVYNGFQEALRQNTSGNIRDLQTDDKATRNRIESVMPYIAERANYEINKMRNK